MKNPDHKRLRFGIQSNQTLRRNNYKGLFDDYKLGEFLDDIDNDIINGVSKFPIDLSLRRWNVVNDRKEKLIKPLS